MRSDEDRAVSEVIGVVLMFGLVVASLSIVQAQVIPTENKQVEIDHYEQAGGEMSQLQSTYLTAAGSTTIRATTVTPGTRYPQRILFVNGPPPQGRVHTTTVSNGTITAEGFNVSQACGTTTPVNTRAIEFETDYNHFSDSQTPAYVFEHTVVHQQSDGLTVSGPEQLLVESTGSGVTLNLYPLTSNFSRSGVEPTAIEFGSVNPITTSAPADSTVTIPTTLSAAQWNRLLSDEPVTAVQSNSDSNRVTLNVSATDQLQVRCAPVATGFPTTTAGASTDQSDSEIRWLDPSGQAGVTEISTQEYIFDASATSSVNLTAKSNATGADVGYSTTNPDVVSLSRFSGTTNSGGTNSTIIRPTANGSTTLFAAKVPSSDSIQVQTQNTAFLHGIVFTNSSSSSGENLFTLKDGRTKTRHAPTRVKAIGPITTDVDGNPNTDVEIPFVNDENQLRVIAKNGANRKLADNATTEDSLLAVGEFNGSKTSVFYANSTGGISRATAAGPVKVTDESTDAILGIGDIDSDGTDELVFEDVGNNAVDYLEDDGTVKSISSSGFGQTNGNKGIGAPADFDSDGTASVPIVDGNGKIKLLNATDDTNHREITVTNAEKAEKAEKASIASRDVDQDSVPEIVYIQGADSSDKLKYIDGVQSETPRAQFVKTADGSNVTASPKRGVA